jgi:uncharacterized protein YcfJ
VAGGAVGDVVGGMAGGVVGDVAGGMAGGVVGDVAGEEAVAARQVPAACRSWSIWSTVLA